MSIRKCVCIALLCMPLVAAALRVIDDDGRKIEFAGAVSRIVSLSPGATEMLFAAGAGDRVVGTADFSDEPAAARRIPRIGDSRGYDLERILALKPDVVVVWSTGTNAAQIERLQRAGLRVFHHRVARLDDIAPAIENLGSLAGTRIQAERAAGEVRARIDKLRSRPQPQPHPTVLLQVWDLPVYTVGRKQLLTDALGACGFRNVFDDLPEAGPAVTVEAVIARDPTAIVAVAPDEATARQWLDRWRAIPSLRAVRRQQLLTLIDSRFSRLGPSAVAATEALCQRLASSLTL